MVICYDTDAAGVKATARALEIFAKTNLSVFVLTLPDGKDPDEFIKNNGPEAFSLVLKKAKTALKYQLDMARKPYNLDDMNDKVAFAREAASILAKVESEIERDAYLKSIADESGISPDAIWAEIKKKNSRAARREAVGQMKKNVSQAPVQVKDEETGGAGLRVKPKVLAAERLLLMLFAQDRAVFEAWRHVVDESYFQVPLHKSLAEAIKKEYETQKTIDLRNILNQFDAGLAGEISAVFASQSEYENNQNAARDAVETIELENIDGLIHKYAKENDIVKLNELLKRKAQINADERRA